MNFLWDGIFNGLDLIAVIVWMYLVVKAIQFLARRTR